MGEDTDDGGTTEADYRWKGLSTVMVLAYGLGFPAWLLGSAIFPYAAALDGTVMSVLVLAWLGCWVYAIGPENLEAAKQLRG